MNPVFVCWLRRLGVFTATVAALCVLGAVLGAALFVVVGTFADSHLGVFDLARAGARAGGFLFLVWAPGLALVHGFVRGARRAGSERGG